MSFLRKIRGVVIGLTEKRDLCIPFFDGDIARSTTESCFVLLIIVALDATFFIFENGMLYPEQDHK